MAQGADKGADTGIRGPYQRAFRLHSPKDGHAQVLIRRACHPIPGVVCEIDEDMGPVLHLRPCQLGKDDLKADKGARRREREFQRRGSFTGLKIPKSSHSSILRA